MGWRQRLEQAYRFEAALELVRHVNGAVLDVGAGLGSLAEYAASCGIEREWIAVEPRAEFAQAIRDDGRYAQVYESPFADVEMPHVGCAVAVGVLTGTSTVRVADLIGFLRRAPAWMLTVLDRDALRERVAIGVEHASAACTFAELEPLAPGAVVRISTTDFAGFSPGFTPRSIAARFRATVDGPWGDEPPEEVAWLACELGLTAEAGRWLGRADPDLALVDIVRRRLRLRTPGEGETQ